MKKILRDLTKDLPVQLVIATSCTVAAIVIGFIVDKKFNPNYEAE